MTVHIMGKRVARLELRNPGDSCIVAVVTAAFPSEDLQVWADALLSGFGWCGRRVAVWVLEGSLNVVLPPTDTDGIDWKLEHVWLTAADTYPHVVIISSPEGILVTIYNSAEHEAAHLAKMAKELSCD
ncbi:MAG: hypothetical protein EOP21_07530 [Hyphomicrobiales bacterium]|nr:MAG: hypothetical protein EOP21_07530 [Hyphomicrobiales bacterium]